MDSSPEQPVALELAVVVVGPDAVAQEAIETNAADARRGIREGLGIAERLGVSERVAFWLGIAGIVAVAAILRLVNLSTRGTWDADQGHDMLVLRDLVQRGQVPLLGPPTSIGDFHHGVLYYFLLAPAAALSGADPTGVTVGDRARRRRGGCRDGLARPGDRRNGRRAGRRPPDGRLGQRRRRIDLHLEPEPDRPVQLDRPGAAWRAWQARRPRWWIVAGAAAIVTMHCHVLGVVLTPVIAGLLVADLVRRRRWATRTGHRRS